MGERKCSPCPLCKGAGQILIFVECMQSHALEECGSCDGTGFWGGAYPPEPTYLAYLERMKLI